MLPSRQGAAAWVEQDGEVWRSISYIGAATTTDVITDRRQAREVGYGLGMFHSLISDLPVDALADTLEDFHVTPSYLRRFDAVLCEQTGLRPSAALGDAMAFVEQRRDGVDVLEAAVEQGELHQRPIHGDPKINNVMMDEATGQAVGLIDLDTVKPGLIHYDIGDCLRSCCNPFGEETRELDQVRFDLGLAESILEGYLSVAAGFLSEWDRAYLPDCIRLIPFELGLVFLRITSKAIGISAPRFQVTICSAHRCSSVSPSALSHRWSRSVVDRGSGRSGLRLQWHVSRFSCARPRA